MGVVVTRGDRERLRAELAGKAMAAFISRSVRTDFSHLKSRPDYESLTFAQACAIDGALAADALLAELERTAEDPIKAGGTERVHANFLYAH